MRARTTPLLEFLKLTTRLNVTCAHRPFCWGKSRHERLWKGICASGRSDSEINYFLGCIVFSGPTLVDGLQRMVCTFLLMEALARRFEGGDSGARKTAEKIRLHLANDMEHGDRVNKLGLVGGDGKTMAAILARRKLPANSSNMIASAFEYYRRAATEVDTPLIPWTGLRRTLVVQVSLDATDNPNQIYLEANGCQMTLEE